MWAQIKHRTDKKEAVTIGFFCNYRSNNKYHNHRNNIQLKTIIEGESLFNDATRVISFNIIKGIIVSSVVHALLNVSVSFIYSMVGAIALGTGIGWIEGKILNTWKADEYVDFTFSLGLSRWVYNS